MTLARRALAIKTSPTLALDARTKELQRQGVDIISFAVGEPDFDTPQHIKEAAIEAIAQGFTKYTPANGIPELREAIAAKFKKENGLDYKPADTMVSVGAKHCIFNAVMVLCDEGDEVLIPVPYWVSYPEMVRVAGGVPVEVQSTAAEGFKLSGKKLAQSITPKTRALILNSPSNPSGAVYHRHELEELAEVILKHNLWVISDEIYEHLIYDGYEHVSIAALGPEIKARTVVVNGVSKAFAMTGWRIGYLAAPPALLRAMGDLQSHATSNANSIAQKASVAALTGPKEPIVQMAQEFDSRRRYMTERIRAFPGFSCQLPAGAFYVFPDITGVLGKKYQGQVIQDDNALAELILTEAHVAVVPGSGFGSPSNLRFSYATSMAKIEAGLDRIERFLGKLE
ncbi:MAG: pyridoxal phosphate-dependent aminotransferase [Bacillota bacterium]